MVCQKPSLHIKGLGAILIYLVSTGGGFDAPYRRQLKCLEKCCLSVFPGLSVNVTRSVSQGKAVLTVHEKEVLFQVVSEMERNNTLWNYA